MSLRLCLKIKRSKPLKFLLVASVLTLPTFASSWRIGGLVGFGASGITKQVEVDDSIIVAEKSENPGYGVLFIERPILERYTISIDHSRGFGLGPFTTGVGFTGGTLRYFFLAPAQVLSQTTSTNTFTVRQLAPYVGGSSGIAFGTIIREADEVDSVSESGVYIGIKVGMDLILSATMGFRTEISVSSTIFASSNLPGTLSEFGLTAGLYFPL